MEQRIIELEKMLAFQANEIEEINEVITEQQKRISDLEGEIKVMTEKITSERLVKPVEDEEPPPHY